MVFNKEELDSSCAQKYQSIMMLWYNNKKLPREKMYLLERVRKQGEYR